MYPEVLDFSIDAIVIKSMLRDMGVSVVKADIKDPLGAQA